jgi:hypothetical protein
MANKKFHKLVCTAKVCHDHREVVLRSTKKVGAKHDGKTVRGHLVMLLKIGHSDVTSCQYPNTQETKKNRLVKVFRHTFEQIEIGLGKAVNYSPDSIDSFVQIFMLCIVEIRPRIRKS